MMIKKVIPTVTAVLSFALPAFAQSAPILSYETVPTGYGQFGCMQRAESKVYQIGATKVTRNPSNLYATYGTEKISVWCRGSEAIVIVAGQNPTPIRDEVMRAF